MSNMEQEFIEKLLGLKKTIADAQKEYASAIHAMGYDVAVCPRCKGTRYYSVCIGYDCGGANYDTVKCFCADGHILKKIEKDKE